MLLFGLLHLAASQSPVQAGTPFIPALEWKSQPVAEWVRRLDSEQVSARDAAWCLYYADDRSPAVADALRTALWTPAASEAHHAIDAILVHWNVPFEPLPAAWFPPDGELESPESLFPPPNGAASGLTEALVLDLDGGDLKRKVAAALALLARDEHTRESIAAVVDALEAGFLFDATTRTWIAERVRRGLGSELGSRIEAKLSEGRPDANEMSTWLALLEEWKSCAGGAASALVDLAAANARSSTRAVDLLRSVSGGDRTNGFDDHDFHAPWYRRSAEDPAIEAAVARHYAHIVDVSAEVGEIPLDCLGELHMRVQAYPSLVASITPGLLSLLETDRANRLQVLRILCHVQCPDPRVRATWLEVARAWTDFSAKGIDSFPCLALHDAETLSLLDATLRKAEWAWVMEDKLIFAGQVDADLSPLARWYLDHLDDHPAAWSELVEDGFRGLVDEPIEMPDGIRTRDDHREHRKARTRRINRLALNLATRRDRGEDVAADEAAIVAMLALDYPYSGAGGYEDYVQWGYYHTHVLGLHSADLVRVALRCVGSNSVFDMETHAEAAQAYLENAKLTLAEQVELDRAIPYQAPGQRWRGINIVHTQFDGRNCGQFALERTPTIRRVLYEGNLLAIKELAQITRLIDRDLDYALALLRYGSVDARLYMLDLIEKRGPDVERVREAVQRRLADVDDLVRHRAQRVADSRGW